MKQECVSCKNAYWFGDRLKCKKISKRLEQEFKGEPLYSNACSTLNPRDNCRYFEEPTFDIILDPWDTIETFTEFSEPETKNEKEGTNEKSSNA